MGNMVEIKDELDELRLKWFMEKIYKNDKEDKKIVEELVKNFIELLFKVYEVQKEDKRKLSTLILFNLNTSLYTKTYKHFFTPQMMIFILISHWLQVIRFVNILRIVDVK